MSKKHSAVAVILVAATLALTGCGPGGDSAGDNAALSTFVSLADLEDAYVNAGGTCADHKAGLTGLGNLPAAAVAAFCDHALLVFFPDASEVVGYVASQKANELIPNAVVTVGGNWVITSSGPSSAANALGGERA
ncbi:MAG: hypothetical protein LBJ08_12715 [Bifidobacteriaceae bacterium]|jgi:hypothetical protein|nr:hypothetical protein [Bifidobacteriaceae bacterium]